jgi:hypothetical protein
MANTDAPKTWLLLAFGDDRQYAGNRGYADDLSTVYRYDSFVPNHRRVAPGAVALVRSRDALLGVARIEEVVRRPGHKTRLRCPQCSSTSLKVRTKLVPRYRCYGCKAETDDPAVEEVATELIEARFGTSFVDARSAVPVARLRAACIDHNGQLAMQAMNLDQVLTELLANCPAAGPLLGHPTVMLAADAAEDAQEPGQSYAPSGQDSRVALSREIRARRGQKSFRDSLRRRYGEQCVVTGCTVLDVLEAAHISPYRGPQDNHEENGLLLRADIHTLFDLDLLGIQPDTLEVVLNPCIRSAPYAGYEGAKLRLSAAAKPSAAALRMRWAAFQRSVLVVAEHTEHRRPVSQGGDLPTQVTPRAVAS